MTIVLQKPILPPIPRAGLIAWHDLWFPNLTINSEVITGWTSSNVSYTADAAIAPDGTMTADKVQFTAVGGSIYGGGGAGAGYVVRPSTAYTHGLWLRADTGTFQLKLSRTNTLTWATATVSDPITLTTDWQFVSLSYTSGAADTASHINVGSEGKTPWNLPATGSVYAWGSQAYPAATLPAYVATTTLQSITDKAAGSFPLTRGSNSTAADANDPTVLGPGMLFDGTGANDDYAITGNLTTLNIAGPWTLILVAKNTYAADTGLCGIGSAANIYTGIRSSGANTLGVQSADAGGATNSADSVTATDGTVYCFSLVNNATTTVLTRLDNADTATVTNETLTGTPVLTLGGYYQTTGAIQTATIYEALLYGRVLSSAEQLRIRRWLKTKWSTRSVTVT